MENQGSGFWGEVPEDTIDFFVESLIDVALFQKPETFFFLLFSLYIFLQNTPGEQGERNFSGAIGC